MGEPEDQRTFDLLNGYLQRLHTGELPDRDKLVREHPDLAPALKCLDALEGVASDVFDNTISADGPDTSEFQDTHGWSPSSFGLPGDFGPYELLEEIGRGGMGVVFRARQKDLDRVVAIKMILASHLALPEHVRRFRAEARAAAQLQHDHIVRVYDVGELHGQHYFTMEYIEGESLAQRIASSPVKLEMAVRLTLQVARAVSHSHRRGIVHRDLKPSNILLDAAGEPYVMDFGLAKVSRAHSEMTGSREILGTVNYMAPEQAAGRSAEVTPAADVYSLGAILYELLTGRPPFREEDPLDTLMQVRTHEPTLPRQLNRRVPRSLELICLKCLAKSPKDRYSSADQLADDLEHFSRGETLTARPPGLAQRVWNWSRREPALAGRLGALGIFALVEMTIYSLAPVVPAVHRIILIIFAAWGATAVVFQQFLNKELAPFPARFLWGTLDSALLFTLLFVADGIASPALIGYPLLIVGSGLWFHVRFVWFMTALSLLSYGGHVLDFYCRRRLGDLTWFDSGWYRHVIFAVGLLAVAGVVAHLVHRVRTLGSYYGRKA
jgi:serine/threonine-protein kinase